MSADPSAIPQLLLTAAGTTVVAALFTCADAALTSLSGARLEALAKEAHPRFRAALTRASRARTQLQARYLAGRLLSVTGAVASFTIWLARRHEPPAMTVLWAGTAFVLLGAVLEGAASSGRGAADLVVPVAGLALRPLELVVAPVATVSHALARIVRPWRRAADPRVTETEVEIMVDQGEQSGVLERDNAELIRNVLEFSDLTARDAMIPRKQVEAIQVDTPLEQVMQVVVRTGHSRYPVYREDIDDVFGLMYAKDLFRVARTSWRPPPSNDEQAPAPASTGGPTSKGPRLLEIVREPVKLVPEGLPLSDLLRQMRQQRQHLAVVVDEFGGTCGIVTLEDVLEEIVGDIRDEHDSNEAPIVELEDGRLLVDAAVLLSDLSSYLGYDLDPSGEYDSVGGMITDKLARVPAPGATLSTEGASFVVRESDEKHITKVEVQPCGAPLGEASIAEGDRQVG